MTDMQAWHASGEFRSHRFHLRGGEFAVNVRLPGRVVSEEVEYTTFRGTTYRWEIEAAAVRPTGDEVRSSAGRWADEYVTAEGVKFALFQSPGSPHFLAGAAFCGTETAPRRPAPWLAAACR